MIVFVLIIYFTIRLEIRPSVERILFKVAPEPN